MKDKILNYIFLSEIKTADDVDSFYRSEMDDDCIKEVTFDKNDETNLKKWLNKNYIKNSKFVEKGILKYGLNDAKTLSHILFLGQKYEAESTIDEILSKIKLKLDKKGK